MASITLPIESGKLYHIYNRGINSCNIFDTENDYKRFSSLYEKYVNPIADTYAWVLMPNHFHILVRIKENVVYKYSMGELNRLKTVSNAIRSADADRFDGTEINKWETISVPPQPDSVSRPISIEGKEVDVNNKKRPNPTKHLSHLFNAYSKYYNKRTNRHGSLFERAYRRKHINSDDYFKQAIVYIHNNPVHHGFVSDPLEYGWSSYLDYLSEKQKSTLQKEVVDLFGDKGNFEYCHKNYKSNNTELE